MKIFVRPIGGLKVRDPKTREYLPTEGKSVERNSYWIRRQMEGEVEFVAPVETVLEIKKDAKK